MSGHIFDMVNRIRQNKIPKRKKFQGDNRAMMHTKNLKTTTSYTFPTASESEMERIKIQIEKTAKANYRKSLYVLAIVIAIVAFAFWVIIKYYKVDPFVIY